MEDRWAIFEEDEIATVSIRLNLLEALHQKWVYLMNSLEESDWNQTYYHPEEDKTYRLKESLIVYQWHGKHQLAHITELKKRNGW